MATQKPINSLIIDTGPLIKNTVSISTILQQAEEIYTTPAILSEIRDPATRSQVETTLLPFLKVRNPTPASYEVVTAFSKKTGDFPVLSRQDLGILALAYEINCERHDENAGLRTPGDEVIDGATPKKQEVKEQGKADAQSGHVRDTTPEDPATKDVDPTSEKPTEAETTESAPESTESPQAPKSLEEDLSKLRISRPTPNEDLLPSSDDDSDEEWITPTNLAQHQAKDSGVSSQTVSGAQMPVATMTTDFAMQNVLLQMNLSLLSTNLQRISTLRTYILRCHACFLTTKEMAKQFCPRCGQPTLNRVACTTNAKGEFKIHLSNKHQWNNRGNRYSVPKPVAGTASGKMNGKGGGKGGWGRDLVLAEDQKEYLKKMGEEKRSKTRDLMDEDYLPGILTGDRGRTGGRPKVGAGKNVNSRKKF